MTVITTLHYKNKHYYVIKDVHTDNRTYWGTVDFDFMKDGRLTKPLNGLDMCVSFESVNDAIKQRKQYEDVNEFVNLYGFIEGYKKYMEREEQYANN